MKTLPDKFRFEIIGENDDEIFTATASEFGRYRVTWPSQINGGVWYDEVEIEENIDRGSWKIVEDVATPKHFQVKTRDGNLYDVALQSDGDYTMTHPYTGRSWVRTARDVNAFLNITVVPRLNLFNLI